MRILPVVLAAGCVLASCQSVPVNQAATPSSARFSIADAPLKVPLANALVTVTDSVGTVLGQVSSATDGSFKLDVPGQPARVDLEKGMVRLNPHFNETDPRTGVTIGGHVHAIVNHGHINTIESEWSFTWTYQQLPVAGLPIEVEGYCVGDGYITFADNSGKAKVEGDCDAKAWKPT